MISVLIEDHTRYPQPTNQALANTSPINRPARAIAAINSFRVPASFDRKYAFNQANAHSISWPHNSTFLILIMHLTGRIADGLGPPD